MFLYTFDPGRVTGISIWSCYGELLFADSVNIDVLVRWLRKQDRDTLDATAVVEIPNHLKESLDNVIKCAVRAGEIGGFFSSTKYITPLDWKRNLPKAVSERRSRSRLTATETSRVLGKDNNCWDAIGIGLWHWKRD